MSDVVYCPMCGKPMTDLYELGWENHNGDQEIEVECGTCETPLFLSRVVDITYKIEGVKAQTGKRLVLQD